MYFPLCQLHNTRIVHRLPQYCPLATTSPCGELSRMKDQGWATTNDLARKATLEAESICEDCVSELSGHPHVKRLREKKGK